MMQWQRSLFLVVCFALGIAPDVLAEGEPISRVQPQQVIRDIPSLKEVEQPLTTAEGLLVQQPAPTPTPALAQVTGVQLKPTEKGLEVILETTSEFAEVLNSETENSLITDIPNAQLRLPKGEAFRQDNPTQEIASVEVTNLDARTLRVTVTGKAGVPTAEVSQSPQALILSVAAPPAPVAPPAPAPQPIPAPTAPAEPQQPEPQAEEERLELEVRAEEEVGNYNVPNASTATRTDTPILDIPASIQVVPQQVLEDQQVIRLEEALENVSGVTVSSSGGNTTQDFNIRGFDNAPVLIDGFRQFEIFGESIAETVNLERVEVLKGPASILYGEIQPGGVINLVTKQPLAEPFYEAEVQVGNRDLFRPQIDISGPLTSDRRLRYRLNALYQQENSFRDFDQDIERFFIAPVVSWQLGDRTDLTVQFEYLNEELPFDNGLVAVGEGVADIPFERNLGEPDNSIDRERTRVGYNLEHRFSDNWRLRNAFRYTRQEFLVVTALPFDFNEDTGIFNRYPTLTNPVVENYSLQTNVVGEFATGSFQHTLLFGVDLQRNDTSSFTRADFSDPQPLNIFDPEYGAFADVNFDELPIDVRADILADRLGIYLQDQVNFSDNLILLAGLRYDTVERTSVFNPTDFNPTSSETTQNDNAVTPRIGIVYKPIPIVSLYGSYSQSFTPSTATTSTDDFLEPERGEGFEVGVKTELLEGRLTTTLAYFDITRQNVATTDPNDATASVATGEQQSQGVELDVAGEILPGWNVIASYAYIDAEVTEDNTIPVSNVGNRLFNTPEHSASLWTTYEIQRGDLQGLGFGIGFNFVGERVGDLANSFEVDSYFLTNAAIFYRRNDWRLALNIKNLFNTDYIEATGNNRFFGGISPGEPFTIIGSVSIRF